MNLIIDIIVLKDKIRDKDLMVAKRDVGCYGTLATWTDKIIVILTKKQRGKTRIW